MYTFKTKTLAACAILGLASAGPSMADISATSYLDITNFLIKDSGGNTLDFNNDFSSLSFTSSTDMDGSLTGAGSYSYSTPNATAGEDFAADCLGSGCNVIAENTFPLITGAQGTTYVTSDQREVGSPITNLPNFTQVGADVSQGAYGSIATGDAGAGTSNVNNGLEAIWTFSLAQAGGISFDGDFRTYLEAFVGAGEVFPGKASASTSFSITINDVGGANGGGVIFNVTPTALNQSVSANANGFGFDLQLCGIFTCGTEANSSFSFATGPLAAGNLYQLAIRSNANIDIARVPEPGFLGLMGLGLLGGFSWMRRRRS